MNQKNKILLSVVLLFVLAGGYFVLDKNFRLQREVGKLKNENSDLTERVSILSQKNNDSFKTKNEIDTSDWQLSKEFSDAVQKFPRNWYLYSFSGGPASSIYFTDGGEYAGNSKKTYDEIRDSLARRTQLDGFRNECLISIDERLDDENFYRIKINTKLDNKEKETCDLILAKIEEQIPAKNERAAKYLAENKKIDDQLKNYTILDNCGSHFKDEKNKRIYFVKYDYDAREIIPIDGVDFQSFQMIAGCLVAKDKNNVYVGQNIFKDADANTIKLFQNENLTYENELHGDEYFLEDKNNKFACNDESCRIIKK